MLRTKIFTGILLTLTVAVIQISPALAAPLREDPTPTPTPTLAAPVTGTIQSITLQTDSANVTTVAVLLTDGSTVNISLDTAFNLGLVTTNDPTTAVANDSMIGQTVEIPSTDVITPPAEEEAENPVGGAIAAFFGIDYQTLEGYHEDGVGYGVIAQSCWLSFALGGDASQCGAIIEAKQSGDYSAFTLPDGTTASNWGQFKKAILDKHDPLKTLGAIMSGHAHNNDSDVTDSDTDTPETDAVGDDDHGNGNGHGNGHDDGDGNGNGHGKGHGKP
jgi:hypothetical protein